MKIKTKKRVRKIAKYVIGNLLEFKIRVPVWLCGFIILLPLIAYGDLVMFSKRTFFSYLGVCALELFLVYIGFSIAYNTYKIKQLGDK